MKNRTRFSVAVGLALAVAPLSSAAADAVPRGGLDVVVLSDGRVVRCRAGATTDGRVELAFEYKTIVIPKTEVLEIRRFTDYDPVPRTEEEKRSAEAGLVHWGGRWVGVSDRATAMAADRERERKLRAEVGASLDWESRCKRTTTHFAIEANLAKKDVDYYENLLESFYDYFTSGLKVAVKRRIPVFIFRTREEFQDFHQKETGEKAEHICGYFMPAPGHEHLVLYDWQGDRGETVAVLFHEATHLFIHLASPEVGIPPMFNEGLAEYYGAAVLRNGKFTRGRVQEGRLLDLRRMIAENRLPSLDTLLARGHPDHNAPDWKKFASEDYAQAWAFVHFIYHGEGGKYLPRMLSYLNTHWSLKLQDAAPGGGKEYHWMRYADDRALLLKCLRAKDYSTLEAEFLAYVKDLSYEGASGLVSQGFFDLRKGKDPAKAEKEFREALEKAGDDVGTLTRLVKAFSLMEGHEQDAVNLLERAVALDPLNMAMRYELTSWLQDGSSEVPHVELCADFDPMDPIGLNARAWLSFRGIGGARHFTTGLMEPDDLKKEREGIQGRAKSSPEDLLRLAEIGLRLSEPESSLAPARGAAVAMPGDPAAAAALAKAIAVTGDEKEFVKCLTAFREADLKRVVAEGLPRTMAERETDWAFVEGVSYALALEKLPEARKAVDAWLTAPGNAPRTEGDWILYAGLALKAGDFKVGIDRIRKGLKAAPGSGRLVAVVNYIPDDALPPDLLGGSGDDGD